jgi:hypothetical protein
MVEGIGWATTAVQGEDELAGQSFVQWVCLDPGGQFGQQSGVVATAEPNIGVVQFGRDPFLVHGVAEGVGPRGVQTCEGISPPEAECPPEQGCSLLVLLVPRGRAGPCGNVMETVQIHGRRRDVEDITTGSPDDICPLSNSQSLPQTGEVAVERVPDPLRQAVGPDALDKLVHRNHPVGVHKQHCEHTPLPGVTQIDDSAIQARLDAAEQSELNRHSTPPSLKFPPLA